MEKVFYFICEASPKPGSKNASKFGGAFINSWIRRPSEAEALERIKTYLERNDWIVSSIKESNLVSRDFYKLDGEGIEYFEQAMQDGECFVIHTWPLEIQNE